MSSEEPPYDMQEVLKIYSEGYRLKEGITPIDI
jgi:hypothetical protein